MAWLGATLLPEALARELALLDTLLPDTLLLLEEEREALLPLPLVTEELPEERTVEPVLPL